MGLYILLMLWQGSSKVKCPFSCRDKPFSEAVKEKRLKIMHTFSSANADKDLQSKVCDFVEDGAYFTQRIEYDEDCTENALIQVKSFVKLCLLTELVS